MRLLRARISSGQRREVRKGRCTRVLDLLRAGWVMEKTIAVARFGRGKASMRSAARSVVVKCVASLFGDVTRLLSPGGGGGLGKPEQ